MCDSGACLRLLLRRGRSRLICVDPDQSMLLPLPLLMDFHTCCCYCCCCWSGTLWWTIDADTDRWSVLTIDWRSVSFHCCTAAAANNNKNQQNKWSAPDHSTATVSLLLLVELLSSTIVDPELLVLHELCDGLTIYHMNYGLAWRIDDISPD